MRHAKGEVFLALQAEDRAAVERIEDIAAVPGFDLFFVGPADLSISYGVPMQFDHPILQGAIEPVARSALEHGKWWGLSTGSPEAAQAAVDRAARMISGVGDHPFLVRGFQQAFQNFSVVRIADHAAEK